MYIFKGNLKKERNINFRIVNYFNYRQFVKRARS